jgi:hypothetical protein
MAKCRRKRNASAVCGPLSTPPPGANDGWSANGRRLFLAAMALAGAILVTAGLLLTGELGPGPARPRGLETGPDASVLANQLLRPVTEQGTAPPTSTPAPGTTATTIRTLGGVLPTKPNQSSPTPAPTTRTDQPSPVVTDDGTGPSTTTTTLPCNLLGARSLGEAAQIPPLCR